MRSTKWLSLVVLVGVLLASGAARAGELLIGLEPLEVDAKGKITDAGKAAAVTEVEAGPYNELWSVHLYAQLDKRTVNGPLYLEVYRERKGKLFVALRKEYPDYDGARYVTMDLELESTDGFAAGQTVEIAFVQTVGGRDAKWAKAKLTLLASSAPPPESEPEEEVEGEDEDELEGEGEDEGEDEEAAAPPQPAAPSEPPPVESGNKRGCHVGGPEPSAWLLLVPLLGARRRRRA
jgi:hypothetical protein